MKLRERTEAELQGYRTKLTQIEAAIERDVQMHHDNVHVYGLSGRSMDSVILAHYKLKGATEGRFGFSNSCSKRNLKTTDLIEGPREI